MRIVIPLFDRFTALDFVGPHEVLSRLPGAEMVLVAAAPGPVASDRGLVVQVARRFDEVDQADLLIVPGGPGTRAMVDDPILLPWLRRIHETTRITASVCTGSLVLAAAGILNGVPAVTHFAAMDLLGKLGAVPTRGRYIRHGKIATSAGVSAGIDLALALAAELADETTARAIQLMIEYDPAPPFDSGNASSMRPEVEARMREIFFGEKRK